MKRYFCLLLCLLMILSGCGNDQKKLEKPVRYYYCKADVTFEKDGAVIDYESRDSVGFEDNVFYLISRYLRGPEDSAFAKTFPDYTRLNTCDITESTVTLSLSNEFALLSGVELSLACAALTMTVYELTGRETVRICTASELLDGKQMLVFRYSDLLLSDNAWAAPPATSEEPKQ